MKNLSLRTDILCEFNLIAVNGDPDGMNVQTELADRIGRIE
jgi:hypothetical protein